MTDDYSDDCPRCQGEDGEYSHSDLCVECIVEATSVSGGSEGAEEAFSDTYDESEYTEGELPGGPHAKRAHWMIGGEDLPPKGRPKAPVGPWGADIGESHPTKWSYPTNYASLDTAREWMEKDPRAEHLIYIQWEESELAFVDGDAVYCEEKGEFHPEFKRILNELGATYLDISTSKTGAHGTYIGELPDGAVTEPDWEIDDEPWGSNEDPPSVEIYPTKHVCVMTGRHVVGTPDEAKEWDTDALRTILEDADQMEDGRERENDFDPLPDDYEPEATGQGETTDNIKDVLAAVDRLTADDLPLRSNENGVEASGWSLWDPSYRPSSSGKSLHLSPDRTTFDDKKKGWSFGPLKLFAAEERIITSPSDRLEGGEWFEAVEAAREAGAPIPEYTSPDSSQDERTQTRDNVVLPTLKDRAERLGWAFDTEYDGTVNQEYVYRQSEETIAREMENRNHTLIDGIMGCGKTYSSFKVAQELDEPLFYAAPRADLYDQAVQYALDVGYDRGEVKVMPSLFRHCPSACGDHGEAVEDLVHKLHALGVTPKTLHALLDLPCEEGDDCPYRAQMEFDPDDFEVIIGHYKHTHLPQAVSGRHVVVDEEPTDAFIETVSGDQLITGINTFLGFAESPPYDDFEDLLAARDDPERVQEGLDWFEAYEAREGWDPDESNAVRHEMQDYHALTPHAVYGIISGERIHDDSPYFRTNIDGRNPILFREADEDASYRVTVNRPPSDALQYARSIIGLDGTPMKLGPDAEGRDTLGRAPLWNLALNKRFSVRQVLQNDEREEWLQEVQNVQLIPTTEYVKPYSSGTYANQDRDFAIIEAAAAQYKQNPTVITTKRVRDTYENNASDLPCTIEAWDHYGNIRGSNQYADHRLGVLLGSPHYGDEWMAERAALLGQHIDPDGKGDDREYGGDVADALLESMRESQVAQAALRFGRDGNGAFVVIHTAAYPDWIPTAGRGHVLTTWTEAQFEGIHLIRNGWSGTTEEFGDAVGVGKRQALNILSGFADRGYVDRSPDPEDGRRYVWSADDVDGAPVYGETDLPNLGLSDGEEITKGDVEKLIREVSFSRSADEEMSVQTVERSRSDPPDGGGTASTAPAGD